MELNLRSALSDIKHSIEDEDKLEIFHLIQKLEDMTEAYEPRHNAAMEYYTNISLQETITGTPRHPHRRRWLVNRLKILTY